MGQAPVVSALRRLVAYSSGTATDLGHILLLGPPGVGKRTIAQGLAAEMGVSIKFTSGTLLERKGDLTAILTALDEREVLFLEEIHRLRPALVDILAPALDDFRIDLIIGQGPGQRVHPFRLNRFTCLMAAPKRAAVPEPLRATLPAEMQLGPYSESELCEIVSRIAKSLGTPLDHGAAVLVARSCEGLPSRAEALVKRLCRAGGGPATEAGVQNALVALGISSPRDAGGALNSGLEGLSGQDFELRVSLLLQRMGFRCETTRASGDGGIDVIAELYQPLVGGRYLIQCKRFSADSPVGVPLVREFYGAVRADRAAVKGILITTSYFTDQAVEFAREVGIELIDGEALRRLLANAGE